MAEVKDLIVNGASRMNGDVYALNGYTPSSTYTAITETDSIQTAFGKVEGALSGIEALLATI